MMRTLEGGPARGLRIETDGADGAGFTIATQLWNGVAVVVSSPFSTASGKRPRPNIPITLSVYGADGRYAGAGAPVRHAGPETRS